MTLAEIIEKLKTEHARSIEKHGKWRDLDEFEQYKAIHAEFREWNDAWASGDVHGEHGEINEALHVMNVMAGRIMYLSGEDQ